jgi:hypothetical protein
MLSSDTTGMPSTERMISPPTGISLPAMVTIPSPPYRPMFHQLEECLEPSEDLGVPAVCIPLHFRATRSAGPAARMHAR